MDTAQWHQEIGLVKPLELQVPSSCSSITNAGTTTSTTTARLQGAEKRVRPHKEQVLHCPRCNSPNTKFCYYNNYSLTQPRYFCKTCRRYWTDGGSLRNVPVGGGSRKNKRSSLSTATTSSAAAAAAESTSKKLPVAGELLPAAPHKLIQDGQDLNLAFPHGNAVAALSAVELLRGTTNGMSGAGIGPLFVPMQLPEYSAGFGLQEFRGPVLNFTAEGIGGEEGGGEGGGVGYGDMRVQDLNSGSGRLLFPFEDVKLDHTSIVSELENGRKRQGGDPPPFWNGMIGGGSSW